MFHVSLVDGREIAVPFSWFPLLAQATQAQRRMGKLVHRGLAIRWDDIDEDLLVAHLLSGVRPRRRAV